MESEYDDTRTVSGQLEALLGRSSGPGKVMYSYFSLLGLNLVCQCLVELSQCFSIS
jgi:hypothetical protein